MNLVQNFGKDALDMFSWLENVKANPNQKASLFEAFNKIHKYRIHLSQPMGTWMFVRGEKPKDPSKSNWPEHYEDLLPGEQSQMDRYEEELGKWQNWTPMFEGEWIVDKDGGLLNLDKERNKWRVVCDGKVWIDHSLNDFLTQVTGLKYDDRYEIK